ncbi:hypothetical protein [Streptomyces sp. NPDC046862]|uniref:hypothetical protein n=1 Tax=Streptomyces sp. NPDC046862 TaxID=3154603 RepID=UPI003455B815
MSGWILDDFGYRGVLWFMVIATAISLVSVLFLVPGSPVREARTPTDWVGGDLLGGGMASILYGVGKGGQWGWTSGDTLAFIGGGVVAVIASMMQGVLQAVLTQLAYAVVAQNSRVMRGTAFYVDDSYTKGLLLFAGVVAVATALITLVPKAKRLDEAEVGQAV